VPDELGDLTDLNGCLYLEVLADLPRLRHIDVRSNRLTRLPDWVVDLPALEKPDLRWNACEPSPALLNKLELRGCVVLL
jgi:hypothetical protein